MEFISDEIAIAWTQVSFSLLVVFSLGFFALFMSSYVKIATVLSILRVGLGVNSLPALVVTGALAVSLSFFVMFPTIVDSLSAVEGAVGSEADSDKSETGSGKAKKKVSTHSSGQEALAAGLAVWKKFLQQHADSSVKEEFSKVAIDNVEPSPDSWQVLAPAFVVSELKDAFATGLGLFLPLLVVDLFIAALLLAVGMNTLDPRVVSFPFKLLLFVMVDGWSLITTNLVATYAV